VHHIDDCPTRCDGCGARGHTARSSVCTLRRDRRPKNLFEVATFKRVIEIAPQPEPKQEPAKATAPLPAKGQRRQQAAEKEAAELKAKKEKEEKMRQALLQLEKEKERIMKELAQLQNESANKKPAGRELVTPGQSGRKALKQSRG
jgi:phage-related minor tail protein